MREPEVRAKKFMEFLAAIGKIKTAGVSTEEQNRLCETATKAIHACDLTSHSEEVCDVISGLLYDRYWEPEENGAECSEGAEFIVERACNHTANLYINLAMSLWGDKPAASLTWRQIGNAAHYHCKLDMRNAMRPILDEWGLLPGKEKDLDEG